MMNDMRSFDEPMPSVGVFRYNPNEHDLFDINKKELTPKMIEAFKQQGIQIIDYPFDNKHTISGRVSWNIDKFIVFVG